MKRSRFSFSILLPLLELTIWVALVLAPATLTYVRLQRSAQSWGDLTIKHGDLTATIPKNERLSFELRRAAEGTSTIVTATSLPGLFVEALTSIPTWPDSWHPASLPLDAWRCLSWPVFCLPFWWFVGLGADALLGWKHLHWATLLAGTSLCVLFIVVILGFRFGLSVADRGAETNWIFWGVGLWIGLFGVFPVAWIRQWLARREPTPRTETA